MNIEKKQLSEEEIEKQAKDEPEREKAGVLAKWWFIIAMMLNAMAILCSLFGLFNVGTDAIYRLGILAYILGFIALFVWSIFATKASGEQWFIKMTWRERLDNFNPIRNPRMLLVYFFLILVIYSCVRQAVT